MPYVVCWNVAWNKTRSPKGRAIRDLLLRGGPDIVCCPEAYTDFLPDEWHRIESQADYGYPIIEGRRKVVLWSRHPWQHVDPVGSQDIPSGRFIAGFTTAGGIRVKVIGVCVPWRAAHVTTGHRNRRPWEDHQAYLTGLAKILQKIPSDIPTILLGDINQQVPRRTAPTRMYGQLTSALTGYTVHTSGSVPQLERQPVCHIASTNHLVLAKVLGFPRWFEGKPLSDHDGVGAQLSLG